MTSARAEPPARRRLTARGALTRERIVRAAADLMHANGVAGTTMDQVIEASGTSKSQLYHYFDDKDALVTAVIKMQTARVMERQEPHLEQLSSLQGLRRWRDAVVSFVEERHGAHGCEIGSLASELADRSEPARILINATFRSWESYLAAGLRRMQDRGELDTEADVAELATGIMAAYQGGHLLSQAGRTAQPIALALDLAIRNVEALAPQRKSASGAAS
ncbi:TetR/AcrR family transcriptional regulator [Pseudonocardia xinjiangensis]|uniref:TetR/AcrR family transcriptional regulator n=1 Tax=Pseudonocardia xinjiangensis TaxID=75289 RepID=A0ABX1RBS7_9PSEU|nr:TetR/AcrR family transcriptional regulator [Pseudonocardia xinjiangensis]NMH77364.1 TetR/AcrR family transcriptional regulator [Pseudonocardia xinjiangensis]